MHAGGQHNIRKDEIQLSAFTVNNLHEIKGNITYFFDMDTNVQLMRLDHRDNDPLYQVFVLYKEVGKQSEVGKVLLVNLAGDVS